MRFYFDSSTLGFYLESASGRVEISAAQHAALMDGQSQGKVIVADQNGNPVLQDPPQLSAAVLLEQVKAELRTMRAPMLDALTGIAGRAARAGNDALAAKADALAEHLLDITADPALNAATDYAAMQAAGVAAYRAIAASASPELASVFREITGA